jgi:mRNA-degrading endonuclease toxin of MazEF toxin-antitoxin module
VWLVDLPIGRKPAVIVSAAALNQSLTNVIVARVTSRERERAYPTAVALDPTDTAAVREPSYVICHDILTVPADVLVERWGALPVEQLVAVEAGLRAALDLV